MPNLMQILSIFLTLQAVKQSGPGFLAYPVERLGAINKPVMTEKNMFEMFLFLLLHAKVCTRINRVE